MRMFKKEEGFTLVELMVVVLIIGILVAIAIPVFNNATATARERTCHANQRTIDGAVQQFLADNEDLTIADVDDVGTVAAPGELVPAFIAEGPTCPAGGAAYTIEDGVLDDPCPSATEDHGTYL